MERARERDGRWGCLSQAARAHPTLSAVLRLVGNEAGMSSSGTEATRSPELVRRPRDLFAGGARGSQWWAWQRGGR